MNTKTFDNASAMIESLRDLLTQITHIQEKFRTLYEKHSEANDAYLTWLINLAQFLGCTHARARQSVDGVSYTCRVAIDGAGSDLFAGEKQDGGVSMEDSFSGIDAFLKHLSCARHKVAKNLVEEQENALLAASLFEGLCNALVCEMQSSLNKRALSLPRYVTFFSNV